MKLIEETFNTRTWLGQVTPDGDRFSWVLRHESLVSGSWVHAETEPIDSAAAQAIAEGKGR